MQNIFKHLACSTRNWRSMKRHQLSLIDAYKQVIELAPSNVDASLAVAGLLTIA